MSSFSSLSASLIARQIARVSRPVSPPAVKPAKVACSRAVPSSTFSSLPQSAIARVAARVCRSQTLSTVSSFASSKRSIVGGRHSPVYESVRHQTTLSARAAARASRERPWLNPRADSIAVKLAKSTSKTAQWINSQAVDLRQASRRLPQPSRRPSSIPIRHSPTSDASMSLPAPPIVIPKRRTATPGPRQPVRSSSTPNKRQPVRSSSTSNKRQPVRSSSTSNKRQPVRSSSTSNKRQPVRYPSTSNKRQPVRYPSTSNNRAALPPSSSSSSSRLPQQVVPPASPDKSIAEIVREAFAFDINQFRAEVQVINDKIAAHRKYLRRLKRKPVTFDDNPTVIEHPRWIEREHVFGGPPRMMGYILAWRPIDGNPYEHILVWGTDPETSNFDHSDCENPECHRRAKDLYMLDYEEWTPPTWTMISE